MEVAVNIEGNLLKFQGFHYNIQAIFITSKALFYFYLLRAFDDILIELNWEKAERLRLPVTIRYTTYRVHQTLNSMKAEETFSSLKKTIKSKFVTESEIASTAATIQEPQEPTTEPVDDRPLYFQLRDNRQKNEEEFEEMFKLGNR